MSGLTSGLLMSSHLKRHGQCHSQLCIVLVNYFTNHKAQYSKNAHRDVTGGTQNEINEAGKKRCVQTIDRFLASQERISNGLGHQ